MLTYEKDGKLVPVKLRNVLKKIYNNNETAPVVILTQYERSDSYEPITTDKFNNVTSCIDKLISTNSHMLDLDVLEVGLSDEITITVADHFRNYMQSVTFVGGIG